MKELKWYTVGICNDPHVYEDCFHIKFFSSKLEAYMCLDKYIILYGTAYTGKVQ